MATSPKKRTRAKKIPATPKADPKAAPKAANPRGQSGTSKEALRLEFAQWLTDPFSGGTQRQWAADHGVEEATLSDWKKHPQVVTALKAWRDTYKDQFGLVVKSLFRSAVGGGFNSVSAAKTLADLLGENAPKKHEINGRMTVSEYLAALVGPDGDSS